MESQDIEYCTSIYINNYTSDVNHMVVGSQQLEKYGAMGTMGTQKKLHPLRIHVWCVMWMPAAGLILQLVNVLKKLESLLVGGAFSVSPVLT